MRFIFKEGENKREITIEQQRNGQSNEMDTELYPEVLSINVVCDSESIIINKTDSKEKEQIIALISEKIPDYTFTFEPKLVYIRDQRIIGDSSSMNEISLSILRKIKENVVDYYDSFSNALSEPNAKYYNAKLPDDKYNDLAYKYGISKVKKPIVNSLTQGNVELLKSLELFDDIITRKGFAYKNLSLSDKGIRFQYDGNLIPLDKLSSGEQNLLIIFYKLLFETSPGAMVLIDEPETSLHVVWQLSFLKDLSKVAKTVGLSFVISTHSPQILSNKIGVAQDLYKLMKK
jgi:predicted ATP-dependent endonuclease of OLD family